MNKAKISQISQPAPVAVMIEQLLPPVANHGLVSLFDEQRRRIQAAINALEEKLAELDNFRLTSDLHISEHPAPDGVAS